jgi:amino acid transporter/nucleotide-binding universal stress UspA family protein
MSRKVVEHTRTLGFRVAFAMGLGTMIAAGIFSLSGTAVAAIGSSAVIAFVLAALVASITAASYSEFASIYSENGGGYLFSSRTFEGRDVLVFAIGASLFMGYTGTTAFYLATMDEWFFEFIIPEAVAGVHLHALLPHGTIGVLSAVLLGALNAQGTEESGTFQVLVTGAKVAVLIAFIGGALSYAGPAASVSEFAVSFQIEPISTVSIAALAFITFFGFSAIAASAGEIIRPRETVPKAIAASIVTVTVLYTLVIVAMVNTPETIAGQPRQEVLQSGETAMGMVAAAFLGNLGQALIVAGAVFSMISASNASVLAASGIGSLMGRRGQAPRRFSRIHPEFGTPSWSVATVTATIVALIVLFIGVFPAHEGALAGIQLGLENLTGFATLNLLLPLSAVNLALVYSRRRYPDMDRPLEVPLVPFLPALGIVANLALIGNLPLQGAALGVAVVIALVGVYFSWGGAPEVEELFQEVVEPEIGDGTYRVLVPIARPERAPRYARLADRLAALHDGPATVQILNVTEVPEQTPHEMVQDEAQASIAAIEEQLGSIDLDAEVIVEGHTCRDIGFDIVQAARDDGADLVVMGYPEEHRDVTETVELEAPCDTFFVSGLPEEPDLSAVNVGAGGGPHHRALLPIVNALGQQGSEIHLINVHPTGTHGTEERMGPSLEHLTGDAAIHDVRANTVAEGLVDAAAENGGILVMGASRTRRLRQWVLGSTPDRVVELAADRDLPVLVYASSTSVRGTVEDWLFPVYRYLRKRFGDRDRRRTGGGRGTSTES